MTPFLILLIAVVTVTALIIFIKNLKKPSQNNSLDIEKNSGDISYPYQKQALLLTKAERSFFGVLYKAVGNEYHIFSKVRLADILKTTPGLDGSKRQSAQNRINSKHVDFVLCDLNNLAIRFVIELDDSSHESTQRQQRDDFVNKALEVADIAIIHFPVKQAYSLDEIKQLLSANARASA
jgi:very-short-patch-repair endonuclease